MGDYELTITHLSMGLGLSVLIKLNYNDGRDTFLGLFDCGSIVGEECTWGNALKKIMNEVQANQNVLNYVHISHFDVDHYNKLENLGIDYQEISGTRIRIEKMIFGCTGDKDIETLRQTFNSSFDIEVMYIRQGALGHLTRGFGYGLPKIPEYQELCVEIELGENLYFRIIPILYHAQLAPKRREGLKSIQLHNAGVYINTGSSVLMVTVVLETESVLEPRVSYIFTGDATVETMKILEKLADIRFKNENKLLLIAHHGARRHVADKEKTNNFATLEWFLGLVKPNAAVVSAMCKKQKGWTHPHDDTMKVYSSYIQSEAGKAMPVTSFECVGGTILVRQKETNKRLYETFKLDEIGDNTLYRKCRNEHYLFYDIEASTSSSDPDEIYIREIRR